MNRFTRLRPSPAMLVACVSLFVALGGVGYAAATIGSSQIKNNSVRGTDIRNSTITGKDVKNSGLTGTDVKSNSLTGSDILESSLGKVNSAGTADTAGTAGKVNGFQVSGQVRASNGQNVTILEGGGFRIRLHCDVNTPLTQTELLNVSAGNDSHMDDNVDGAEEDDFNQGDTAALARPNSPDDIENSAFSAAGSNGSSIHGQTYAIQQPSSGFGGADCVGGATLLGG